ncbi:MAG: ABC transporter permease, partial [Deltaproteobacteria bacterium]|nr:ABC transporter permease [Deltaproteobacteria bacterium]
MRTAWLIAVKDLRLLGRDPVALFWVLGFPVLFAVFFGSVMKAGASDEAAPWPVAVVDEVGTDASRELVRALGASGSLAIEQPGESEARGRVERGEAIARVALRAGGVEIGVDPKRRVEGTLLARLVEGALVEARPPSRPAAALSPDVAQLPRPAPPRVEVR